MNFKKLPYALTKYPTPLFNTPHLATCFGGHDGNSLQLDEKKLMRSVETIFFPQTKIHLLQQVAKSIWQIQTPEYPYPGPLYIDDRFVTFTDLPSEDRLAILPKASEIIQLLKSLPHCRYIWGGNWPEGIPLLPQLYPSVTPLSQLDSLIQDTWKLKGLDCTGLPYYITNGFTPRNSSTLVTYGQPVLIENCKNVGEIISRLQPLDFIVWKGHLIWVIDQEWSIESKHPEGLVRFKLKDRLSEILKEKKPVDDYATAQGERFVVRRWHPEVKKELPYASSIRVAK